MSRWLLTTGLLLLIISATVLAGAITRLIQLHRSITPIRLPLVSSQSFLLGQSGSYVLHAEGPQLSRGFAGLKFALERAGNGEAVPLETILLRSESTTLKYVRLSLYKFVVSGPDQYRLHISGLQTGVPLADHAIVITPNTRGRSIPLVIAIVVSSISLVGGIVMSAIGLFSRSA